MERPNEADASALACTAAPTANGNVTGPWDAGCRRPSRTIAMALPISPAWNTGWPGSR